MNLKKNKAKPEKSAIILIKVSSQATKHFSKVRFELDKATNFVARL